MERHGYIPWPYWVTFRIVGELGRGGMGVVYEAEQLSIGRRVALKVLPFAALLDDRQLQRFKNEARAAGTLHHPHVVPIYSVGTERGVHYYAMQLIDGQSLSQLIEQLRQDSHQASINGVPKTLSELTIDYAGGRSCEESSLEPIETSPAAETRHEIQAAISTQRSSNPKDYFRTVAELGLQAASGLAHAHECGIVHRDIKPANLMLDVRGNVLITDFGLARIESDAGMTMSGDLLGTLRYMSPEQAMAKRVVIDHRTDIYSLGVTLYELLTLQPAFDGADRQELLQKIAFEEPRRPRHWNPNVPTDLETIILKAVSKNAHERYDAARDMGNDLQNFLHNVPIKARRPTPPQRLWKWAQRHQATTWAAGLTLVITCTVSIVAAALIGAANLRLTNVNTALEAQTQLSNERFAEADRERQKAEAARTEERNARIQESEAKKEMRRQLYIAQMRLGPMDWQSLNISRLFRDVLLDGVPFEQEEDLRGWEWYYLMTLFYQEQQMLFVQDSVVESISWSPNGRYVASIASDGIRILDSQTWRLVHKFEEPGKVIAWNPDGKRLAWGNEDGVVHIWNMETEQTAKLLGHTHGVRSVVWHPDGTRLTSSSMDGTIRIWSDETHKCLSVLEGHSGVVTSADWSPDGNVLASSGFEDGLKIWNVPKAKVVQSFSKPGLHLTEVIWSRDGESLVLGSSSGNILLVSSETLTEERELLGHTAYVRCSLSRDGRQLASIGNGSIKVWDLASGNCKLTFGCRMVTCVCWDPQGKRLATSAGFGRIKIWDVATQPIPIVFQAHDGKVDSIYWLNNGSHLACTSSEAGALSIWNVTTGKRVASRNDLGNISIQVSPDGQQLAMVNKLGEQAFVIRILDAKSGLESHVLSTKRFWDETRLAQLGGGMAWSPDSKFLAIWQGWNALEIWDVKANKIVHEFVDEFYPGRQSRRDTVPTIYSVAWSNDNQKLAVVGTARTIIDTASWHVDWEHQQGVTTCATWSPDDEMLATGHFNGYMEGFHATTGTLWARRILHSQSVANGLDWSPDGQRIASAGDDRMVKVLDSSGRELLSLEGHNAPVSTIKWSPDGKSLAAAGTDGTVRIWNASSGYSYASGDTFSQMVAISDFAGGNAYCEVGRFEDAVEAYSRAIKLQPDMVGAWTNRPRAYRRLDRWGDAIKDLNQALSLDPMNYDAHRQLAFLLATCPEQPIRDPERAVRLATKAVQLAPHEHKQLAWSTLGVARYKASDRQGAREAFQTATNLGDDNAIVGFTDAMVHWLKGDQDQAHRSYAQGAAEVGPYQPYYFESEELRRETQKLLRIP